VTDDKLPPPDATPIPGSASSKSGEPLCTWIVSEEARCRRETIWIALTQPDSWASLWGPCQVSFHAGGRFEDLTQEVAGRSHGEFVQIIPSRRFVMYWYLGRARDAAPARLATENSVRLTFKVDEVAPSVQVLSLSAEWRESVYAPRGKWMTHGRAKWRSFLQKLAGISRTMTAP